MTDCSGSSSINADEQQLIKLCLKKPKQWNWELTTSKSSSHIAFPTIQLFDEDNTTLLVQANEANFVAGSKKARDFVSKASSLSHSTSFSKRSAESSKSRTRSPITIVELADDDENPLIIKHDLKTSLSTSDCFSGRTVRKYHRSSSSARSRTSILKRIREFSELAHDGSDTSADEKDERETRNEIMSRYGSAGGGDAKKKYSMRTCNIGTIIVPKDSFSSSNNVPVRRRRRKSSDEEEEKSATADDNVKTALPHSPRIIDVQGISNKISIEPAKFNRKRDVKASSPSGDEVFFLLVKRLQELQCHKQNTFNTKESSQTLLTKNNSPNEKSRLNEKINEEESMGSNVTTAKGGLTGRRTQSQSNIDNKSSINNGICCSTKYSTKTKRKNSNISEYDKKSAFNNKSSNNNENFDDIGKIIANAGVGCGGDQYQTILKTKKNGKEKEKLHGSLPNHLDTDVDGYDGSDDTNSSIYQYSSLNSDQQHQQPPNYDNNDNAQLSAIRKFDEIYQQQHRFMVEQQQKQQHFVHLQHQNLSFRVASTYSKQNFLRSQETNSFRIPQAYGNRVKFDTTASKIIPASNSPSSQGIDQCYDQGYGSERSPEEEVLPPLPLVEQQQYGTMVVNSMPQGLLNANNNTNQMFVELDYGQKYQQQQHYDFITEDCTFNVEIAKGPGGLGLSVSGGIDSTAPYPGLIRIKRLFPHQAAWMTGQLQSGDILLEANGIILTGLTNNEALEVLRTMASVVNLLVCRPHDENFRKLSPPSIEAPMPPLRLRSSFNFKQQQHQYMNQFEMPPGEFEITLIKQQGSLGFTLQKEDDTVLGHYVRALVREPATTDGRIRPGDKIIAVNDIPISNMTHEQAVIFLRQAPDTVRLRLYRHHNSSIEPPSPSSSCELNYKSHGFIDAVDGSSISGTLKRSKLRPEAMSLISDLATRKNTQSSSNGNSQNSSFQSTANSTNTMSSPRRLRKNGAKSSGSNTHSGGDSDTTLAGVISAYDTSLCMNQSFMSEGGGTTSSSGTHTPFSDSSADTLTVVSQQQQQQQQQRVIKYYDPNELPADDDDDDDDEDVNGTTNDGFYDSDELESLEHDNECSRVKRPEYLNLASGIGGQADSGSTPLVSRKPMYKFSIATANAYELNNLDNVDLDAPTSYRLNSSHDIDEVDGEHTFASLPCETLLLACKTENDLKKSDENDTEECLYVTKKFGKNQPLYQSAQVQINHKQRQHGGSDDLNVVGEMANLLKWKGVTMNPSPSTSKYDDNDDDKCSIISSSTAEPQTLPPPSASLRVSIRNAQKDINLTEMGIDSNTHKIITVEMNRRWSCRLGIRLESQSSANVEGKSITVIKEICRDTLAEKDGRLKAGDRVLMINDEIVDSRSTQEIIDMMRIIRGPLCITVARKIDS